ncbi:4-diphosphocytidyl-2C-methyl-D-erythritol kinase [Granulicella tundricola MP5ACTX9]|uniref:4-diphosphocytidyl-2-C-methyl-D-erythritol kinase n=2 Tax=Granulicella TaxID=940557 RepID=E8WWR2_GRATM|nr:4-diphosphocytidyl-2C-methyl-D-erythritol kinase [Granulicella tundricola MP5ACTX9]
MPTHVRSYSKINLGLAIGPPRSDGFHSLVTLYQTLALYDQIALVARPAAVTRITLRSNDPRVPLDARNTVWKMVAKALSVLNRTAEVTVHIQKNLPIQGGMGAGSANAAAALIGLEKALCLSIPPETRLEIAAQVGSDVPLFLVGGASFGSNRGEAVTPAPVITFEGQSEIPCVIALPNVGVSTPQAFRDWDARFKSAPDLHNPPIRDTMNELSRTYASVFGYQGEMESNQSGASGIFPEPSLSVASGSPEKLQGTPDEQLHRSPETTDRSGIKIDLAENSLLALVRTGIENDFETVVFPQYPSLREIKRHLMGPSEQENSAIIAALSGSGSALFGLYRSKSHAEAAQQRLQQHGVKALVTTTLPRPLYWSDMFAE